MGLFDNLDDYLIEYGPSAAIGGGLGFLAGGPIGAAVGATTAVAGQYAGPRAAAALPAGTPAELRKAVEYGVYGLSSGPAIGQMLARQAGARAAIQLQAMLSRSAIREGAKLGVGSGVGAVVGQKAAQAAGAPDWLGEVVGGIAGPFAPGIGRTLRGDFLENRAWAFNEGGPRMKGLATVFGANEANTARVRRTPAAYENSKVYGSQVDDAMRARRQAEQLRAGNAKFASRVDDDEIRVLMGMDVPNPRSYLTARAKGQLPPEFHEVPGMTVELRKGRRRLESLNKQLLGATQREEQAQSLLTQLGPGELVPLEGNTGYVWRSEAGDMLLPEARAAGYTGPIVSDIQTAQGASDARAKLEGSIKTLLGVDDLPADEAERARMLADKILGPDLARIDESLMDPAKASEVARLVMSKDAELKAATARRVAAREADASRHEALDDFLTNNKQYGALTPGQMAQAARDLGAIRSSEDLLRAAGAGQHRFVDIPDEAVLSYDQYLQIADYIAKAQPNPSRASEIVKSLIETPRGSVWVQGASDTLEPRTLVGIDPVSSTARVRSAFQSADDAEVVPLTQLRMRFDTVQQQAMNTELLAARRLGGGSLKNIPRPAIASTRRLWSTRKDYDQAVNRALDNGRPVPAGDGIIEEDLALGWQQFADNFIPAGNTEFMAFTPEDAAAQMAARRNVASLRPPRNSTPESRKTFVETQRSYRQNVDADEGMRFPVEVRDLADEYGIQLGGLDPSTNFFALMRQSNSDVVNIARRDTAGPGGSVGQAWEKYIVGTAVRGSGPRAVLQNFFGVRETSALFTAGTFGHTRTQLSRALARRFNLRGGLLSKEGAMNKLLTNSFDPKGLPDRMRTYYNSLNEGEQAIFAQQFAPRLEHLFEYGAAFPKLANLPEVQMSALNWRYYADHVSKQANLLGVSEQTMARRFSMTVSKGMRQYLDPDVLAPKGNKGRQPDFADLFEMMRQGANGDLDLLRKSITTGAAADLAAPMASFESMAARRVEDKIKALAIDPSKIGPDDLRMNSQGWSIKNLNKWPTELHDDLRALVDIGSGKHAWEGLTGISQKIALGALALDLSVIGVQGFKYAAHSLLAGRPLRAARLLTEGLTSITTDYGFNTFVRQNMDELMYYSSLGLTGGLRGQIAGPELNKAVLEDLPYVGGVFGNLYGLSDIQYGRAVYFWKVQGVRDNIETVRLLRHARGQVSDKFLADVIEGNPSLKAARDDAGGLEAFLLGSNEDSVKSVVRQVQRGFSSVNLSAEGVGPTRQAIEQIMTIVPGFFRGQAGQWAAAVTKPHTLEGHLALSMLAREYMFGGMIALGFARMFGTEERINWDDMTTSSWLGIPMPEELGGGTVSLLPTMGIPRLASRVARETAEAAQGEGFDGDRALEAFAHGRLSPLVGAFYDNIKNEDFLGRKYDSEVERWGASLTSVLPIVMQSAIEDANEEWKHYQSTGDFNAKDVAISSGLELFGKGLIPKHPADQLNTIAQGAFETDWQMLTDAEKDELRKVNPGVGVAEAEYDFWTGRRAGSTEAFIDRQFKDYSSTVDSIWNEPRMISGIQSTQVDDDQRIEDGSMTGDTWRERYHMRQQAAAQEYESLQRRLNLEGVDIENVRAERMARLAEGRPEDRAVLLQLARAEYTSISPEAELRTVATPVGEVTLEVVNWDSFYQAREDVLSQYPTEVREAVRRSARADQFSGVESYQQASTVQREIEALGRYRGLTPEQGEKLDRMRSVVTEVGNTIRGQAGAASGSIPKGLIQQAAIQQMQASGIITSESDLELMTLAFAMDRNQDLANVMRNPAQVNAILNNPLVAIYYPYLRWRVPQELWPQLPQQIFQAEQIEALLAASVG